MTTMAGRVTIREVADAAGVSRQTVSNSLIHPERVKGPTLERVRRVIDELGYRPSNAAQSLRSQRTGAVGFELNATGSAMRNAVSFPFVLALSERAPAHIGHIVTFGTTSEHPLLSGYEDMVRSQLVDAFILADTHEGDPRPDWLDGARIPYAAFGRLWGRPELTSWADVDGAHGLRIATEHLLAQGYSSVGFLGWPAGSQVGDDRRRGWAAVHEDRAMPLGPEATTVQDLGAATAAAGPLLDQVGRGGAVACASDMLALGVERAAAARGWRSGADIGICGFDDSAIAEIESLTSVAQPLYEIADHLLGLLQARLGGAPPPDAGLLVEPGLTIRSSSTR